jgi:pyrroline-5-carboxylate reductase
MSRTAFIGGGNMARALVRGLLRAGHTAIEVADPSSVQRAAFEPLGVATTADNAAAVSAADTVVLAVKPQQMATVVRDLADALRLRRPLVISVAAGVPVAAIEGWCGAGIPVIRCMPNTPALVGAGITALYASAEVPAEHYAVAESLLATVGETLRVATEAELDAVTAISGSGPAYVFLFLEALAEAGVALGLSPEVAARLALHTGAGAARLALQSGAPLASLREQVTSKGGTTERALAVFEAEGLRALVQAAALKACQRSRELAAELAAP